MFPSSITPADQRCASVPDHLPIRRRTTPSPIPPPPCAFDASGLELVDPATPSRGKHVETSGPPKFPWSLICPFAHAHATPAGRVFLTIHETPVLPSLLELRRLRRHCYRGSVTWLPNSLSTPRGAGYPYPTQDSLPVAGQAFPDGTFTRKGSAERFPSQLLIDIPLSRASWRNQESRVDAHSRGHPARILYSSVLT